MIYADTGDNEGDFSKRVGDRLRQERYRRKSDGRQSGAVVRAKLADLAFGIAAGRFVIMIVDSERPGPPQQQQYNCSHDGASMADRTTGIQRMRVHTVSEESHQGKAEGDPSDKDNPDRIIVTL